MLKLPASPDLAQYVPFRARMEMKTEADLGQWLDTLGAGRAGCVFAADVADTLSVLYEAATSEGEPLRVVSLTWQEVPPLANELGLLVSALGRATLECFPSLYGLEQATELGRWSQSAVESEAHAITRAVADVDGVACRRILSACHEGRVPALGKLVRSEQARQLALAIEPTRLVVMIAVVNAPAVNESLHSLAQGAEWLAGNAGCRVALVLPRALSGHAALDHVTYDACLFADATPVPSQSGPNDLAKDDGRAQASAAAHEPAISVSPIVGRPAKRSDAEQALSARLNADAHLCRLFGYNQHIRTRFGTNPNVDLLWESGKLVIEVDGDDHRGPQKYSADRRRDLELLLSGYMVVRFTSGNVIENQDWVIEKIREAVRYLSERNT
jgi:very-short-patch-repair endonuclease